MQDYAEMVAITLVQLDQAVPHRTLADVKPTR